MQEIQSPLCYSARPAAVSSTLSPALRFKIGTLAGYFQDDWKVTRTLTINLGLRYETETPYTERRNKLSFFDANAASPIVNAAFPNLKGAVQFLGGNGADYPYGWDKNNFAPRIGLAWSATQKLVLRSAFGVFYAGLETDNDLNNFTPITGTTFAGTTAFLGTLDGFTPFHYVSNPYPAGLVPPLGSSAGASGILGQSISSWDNSGRTPYNLQWNFDVQYQLTNNLLADVAYAASRGVHFARTVDINALNPQYLSLGTRLNSLVGNPFYGQITTGTLSQPTVALSQLLKPFPQYTAVNIINSPTADSSYNSIQVKIEQRLSKGQTILASFTAGKLISNANNSLAGLGVQANTTNLQNPYNLRAERSVSEQDQAQALSISYVSELPFGKGRAFVKHGLPAAILGDWTLATSFSFKGGFPLALSAPITGGGNRPNSTGKSAGCQSAALATIRYKNGSTLRRFSCRLPIPTATYRAPCPMYAGLLPQPSIYRWSKTLNSSSDSISRCVANRLICSTRRTSQTRLPACPAFSSDKSPPRKFRRFRA